MDCPNAGTGARKFLIQAANQADLGSRVATMLPTRVASFVRYLVVGSAATGLQYALLLALVEITGANAGLSATIGAAGGALAAYAGNRRFTFRSRSPHDRTLPRFALVATAVAVANGIFVWFGSELLQMHYLVAQLTVTAPILWVGFVLNRSWSFA